MTPAEFTAAVSEQLHMSGAAFDAAELHEFLAAMWPWADDDPDPVRWAAEFLSLARATVPAE